MLSNKTTNIKVAVTVSHMEELIRRLHEAEIKPKQIKKVVK